MTFQSDIASDVQNLAVGNIVNLYELDMTEISGNPSDILYFTESIDNDYTPISFNAREYTPIHMQTSGWQVTGTESLPRPKIIVSNVLLTFASYINSFNDLVGATLIRRRTLEKYLDGKPEANPNAEFAPDIFRIRSLPQKTKAVAEFELAPFMDHEGIKIPKRLILRDFCRQAYRNWNDGSFDYSNASCPYVSTYCYTRLGAYTADCSQDDCGKELTDCEMRYAGIKALRGPGTIYIQDTEPSGTVHGDFWLNTGVEPNVWYRRSIIHIGPATFESWPELKPDPLPTWAFPSVARFRL